MFDFVLYNEPRKALYFAETGVYENGSWSKPRETIILGEDNMLFITEIRNDTGLGFHKTRFIKWLPTQTSLF